MSQHSGPYGSMPPSIPNPPGPYAGHHPGYGAPPPPPPPPQVVHVVSKPGGFWRAVTIVIGLLLFIGMFFIGLAVGVAGMIAAAESHAGDAVIQTVYRDGDSSALAIIPIEGPIDGRQAEFVHAAVKSVLEEKRVRGVVLRVDSPGGGVSESDQIWHEVERLKRAGLPVIASYGGVAASGGYYVSCGADQIIAEETCITGSIGVIANVLTFEGLLQKVGVTPVTLVAENSPQKSVANDIYRSWNETDKAKLRLMLDSAYATFNQRVRDGRKRAIPDASKVNSLADGSIYTSRQAKENGLIDSIGYLDDAIALAETASGLIPGRSTIYTIRQPPSLFGDGLFAKERQESVRLDGPGVRRMMDELGTPRVMYLMK